MPADLRVRNVGVLDRTPVLVVGAGAQGLTFALSLARRGIPVVLAEGSGELGGQARSFHYGGFTFDFGLHAFVSRDARLLEFVGSVLGDELTSFLPRAATRLGNGAFVEDSAQWRFQSSRRHFYELLPPSDQAGWNCMAVSKPPRLVYPRRGGFGRLFERMAESFVASGGCLLLNARVRPGDFRAERGRLASVKLRGRRVRVAGCCWTAAPRLLVPEAPARTDGEFLALYHFSVRGEPSVPYHWVRLDDVRHPLLPRLVYFPARFSALNAPRGHHGIGAVVPLPEERRWPARVRPLMRWCRERPGDFIPLVRDALRSAGLLAADEGVEVRTELLPLPPPWESGEPSHLFRELSNFWLPGRWKVEDPAESGVPLQMAAALAAADAVAARYPAKVRLEKIVRPGMPIVPPSRSTA